MRGLPRMLMMFAPMILRFATKYYKKWQANKQQEEFAQNSFNQAEDKVKLDKKAYKDEDTI